MTRAYGLAQALVHAGYDVEVIGVKLTKRSLYPIPPSNIRVTEVNGRTRLYCLVRLAMKFDGDIFYAIKPRPSSYGVAFLKRSVRHTPVMLDINDWEIAQLEERGFRQAVSCTRGLANAAGVIDHFKDLVRVFLLICRYWPNPTDARYIRWMEKAICKADPITVNTRFLQGLYGGSYVPQCKDAGKYAPGRYSPESSRRRYGLSAYTVLMFPGTARPHKGLEDVLVAMDTLKGNLRQGLGGELQCWGRMKGVPNRFASVFFRVMNQGFGIRARFLEHKRARGARTAALPPC